VPSPDFPVHQNVPVRTTTVDGISLRHDVFSTNDKGQEKNSIQKRTTKTLQKLTPALQRILQPGESVLYATPARSPLSTFEQLTAAWWTYALSACGLVVTNKRILFFSLKTSGAWNESLRTVHWGDLQEIKKRGFLTSNVTFHFKDGSKATYTNFRPADAKKLVAIASALLPASSGEQTASHRQVHLCPDCCAVLTPAQYSCPQCGLIFKNEKTMILRSIFLPAGGYFYTGHPLIAIIPAIFEGVLLADILFDLFTLSTSPQAGQALAGGLLILAVFWALETGITILHCRRYIRDFIPDRRQTARAPQSSLPTLGD
jgi:hypothetical protein